jgi:hypothetical protein
MGRAHLAPGPGLVLPRTRGVLHVAHCLRPRRFSHYLLRAAGAIELPAGVALSTGTRRGDILVFSEG